MDRRKRQGPGFLGLLDASGRHWKGRWRSRRDSNPRDGFTPPNGLANRRLQPLGHGSLLIYKGFLPLPPLRFGTPRAGLARAVRAKLGSMATDASARRLCSTSRVRCCAVPGVGCPGVAAGAACVSASVSAWVARGTLEGAPFGVSARAGAAATVVSEELAIGHRSDAAPTGGEPTLLPHLRRRARRRFSRSAASAAASLGRGAGPRGALTVADR